LTVEGKKMYVRLTVITTGKHPKQEKKGSEKWESSKYLKKEHFGVILIKKTL